MRPLPLRIVLWIATLMVLGSGIFAAYQYGMLHLAISYGTTPDALPQVLGNRGKISDMLASLPNVTDRDATRGFWFTYQDKDGNEQIFHFDPESIARENITDDDIAAFREAIASSSVTHAEAMHAVPPSELPPVLQFHNTVYAAGHDGASTTRQMEDALDAKIAAKTATSDDLLEASYLAELAGDYARRDMLNDSNCALFKVRCVDTAAITLKGIVKDAHGSIEGARVQVISRPDISPVASGADGSYVIRLSVKPMEKLRIRAGKRNYSEGFADIVVLTQPAKVYRADDIVLETPIRIVTIDYAKKTVTGDGNEYRPDGAVTIHTSNSTYEIPKGAVVGKDGKPYISGPVDVYLYEFTKGNPPESLIALDTFDQVIGYAGNLMKSFGMPYIQFFAQGSGVELDVLKSNPMLLTYRIADMDALRSGSDHIYRPLTDADMETLVTASHTEGFPIDRAFLIHNQLLAFPAFWVFDRRRGVWDNVGVSVLDTQGTIRTVFYTERDDM